MRVGILGATGGVGRLVVADALAKGHDVRAQSRSAARLAELPAGVEPHAFAPTDAAALATFCSGLDAVIFALGVDTGRRTTLFSDTTRALVPAMERAGARRLIAITGVGAGDTRGHGGFLYDRVIFPLFTRHRYADKDVQETIIRASTLDWTIVRPAPFAATAPDTPLRILTEVAAKDRLTKITRGEVASFVVAQLESDAYLSQSPFIGHP